MQPLTRVTRGPEASKTGASAAHPQSTAVRISSGGCIAQRVAVRPVRMHSACAPHVLTTLGADKVTLCKSRKWP
jgi:hypothetical protein